MRRTAASVACVVAAIVCGGALSAQAPALPVAQPPPPAVSLHVELVEQAACALPSGEFLLMFDLRTIYINGGPSAVSLALSTERVTGMTVTPVSAGPAGAIHVAGPAATVSTVPGEVVVARQGWAQTGDVRAEVKVAAGGGAYGDALAPGEYRFRFHVDVLAHAGRGAFEPLQLATASIPVTIEAPGQVQECGSASLRTRHR
jgi:hypothetical protein